MNLAFSPAHQLTNRPNNRRKEAKQRLALTVLPAASVAALFSAEQGQAQGSNFRLIEGAEYLGQNADGSIDIRLADGSISTLQSGEFRIVGDDIYAAGNVASGLSAGFSLPSLTTMAGIAGGAVVVMSLLPDGGGRDTAAPTFTSADMGEVKEGETLAHNVQATDANGTVKYSLIGGADQARFTINESTGTLTFIATPDYELPSSAGGGNAYAVVVRATDWAGNSADQTLIINVQDVDESPLFDHPSASASVEENASGDDVIFTAAASDVILSDGSPVVYSLDAAALAAGFSIDANTGEVRLSTPLDYETVTALGLTITATDQATGASSTQALTLNVLPINETPEFAEDAVSASIIENSTETIYQAVATDPDMPDTLTYALDAAAVALGFVIDADGNISHNTGLDYETDPVSYTLEVTVTDAGGLSAVQSVLVSLEDFDEEVPVFTSEATSEIVEGKILAYKAEATGTDRYELSGTDAALFDIDANTGEVTFLAEPDYEDPKDQGGDNVYDITITAFDANDNEASLDVRIEVGNDTSVPLMAGAAAITYDENQALDQTVFTATASDDSDNITFSLSGVDASHFKLDSETGILTFSDVHGIADYENPQDSDSNHAYELTINASDFEGNTASQNLTITIGDLDEESVSGGDPASATLSPDWLL